MIQIRTARQGKRMSRADQARDFCKEGAQLSDAHLNLIVGSAITPEVALERGYRTITTKAELERYGFATSQRITPTLLIRFVLLWANTRAISSGGRLVGAVVTL
jgi:hypothetical protein